MRKIVILIVMIITFVVSITANVKTTNVIEEVAMINEGKNLDIYFPRLPDFKFVSEELEVENNISNEEKIKLIINRLIKGSDKVNLIEVMPLGSKLNNVYVENNIAFVDFSKEFVDNHPGGSLGEYNTIYSIVNSITEIDGIEQVVFLIDGKKQTAYRFLPFLLDVPSHLPYRQCNRS
jgi:spore germination protein GerM